MQFYVCSVNKYILCFLSDISKVRNNKVIVI